MLLRGREILYCRSGGNRPSPVRENRSVFFRRENGFRIGSGNFADRDPTDSADERAEQEGNCRQRNQAKEPKNERQRAVQYLSDSNQPAAAMFVNRAVGRAVFCHAQPNQEREFDRRGIVSNEVERWNSMAK